VQENRKKARIAHPPAAAGAIARRRATADRAEISPRGTETRAGNAIKKNSDAPNCNAAITAGCTAGGAETSRGSTTVRDRQPSAVRTHSPAELDSPEARSPRLIQPLMAATISTVRRLRRKRRVSLGDKGNALSGRVCKDHAWRLVDDRQGVQNTRENQGAVPSESLFEPAATGGLMSRRRHKPKTCGLRKVNAPFSELIRWPHG